MKTTSATLALMLTALLGFCVSAGAAGGNSAATISAGFADSCTDFSAHSSKDISNVVIGYADGRVVKDETIASHDYSIAGAAPIDSVIVKSGTTTTDPLTCVVAGNPPTAVLEIETPPIDAGPFPESCSSTENPPNLACEYEAARSAWTAWDPGEVFWGFCGAAHQAECNSYPPGEFPFTFTLRGISSTDPDGDLTSWSIDFGDGTSASGDWATNPPSDLTHTYLLRDVPNGVTLTLTVTDSGGRSDTDTLTLRFTSLNPI